MQGWIVWLVLAAALAVAELFVLTLDLALLAGAALVAGLVGALGVGVGGQAAAFVVAAIALLGFVRPIARRHVRQPPPLRSGVAALVGREALVLREVTRHGGLVRIGGEQWTARPYDPSLVIAEGTVVDVMAIEGATALVYPREEA